MGNTSLKKKHLRLEMTLFMFFGIFVCFVFFIFVILLNE